MPFVAAVQTTEDGRPHLPCISPRPFTHAAMEDFMARRTALPLTLVSDGLNCFKVLTSAGAARWSVHPGVRSWGIWVAELHCQSGVRRSRQTLAGPHAAGDSVDTIAGRVNL